MKSMYAGLLDDVVSSYDQTKTTLQGRAVSKTIDGDTALGPPLNKFIDTFADAAVTPGGAVQLTSNGRLFTVQAEASGLAVISLHSFNFNTGVATYVGKIQVALPDTAATTHVYRGLKVLDSGTTGWKLFLASTGSVLINGGVFLVNNLALADFVPIGFPTINFATGNDQKAVYFLQDPSNIGVGQLNTVSAGLIMDATNNRLYCHNGVAATHQYYVYATDTAPTYSAGSVTGVAATDIISHAGHTFVDNDPVTFTSITGGAGITVGTTYFVRSSIAGTSYQISATSGGAALNFTTDISSGSVGRAFGTTGSNFVHKTGNLPALTGTLLVTDSEDYATPGHTALSGQACAFFATSSTLYLGLLSELTSGATTWPSLITANMLGLSNEITAVTATHAAWSNVLDRVVYLSNTNVFMMKQFVNNSIDAIFGGNNNKYFEAGNPNDPNVVEFQMLGINGIDLEAGYLLVSQAANVGQRGVFITDLRSDARFGYSYIVTKVLTTQAAVLNFITTIDKLYDYTGSLVVYARTSGFGSISGGWTQIAFAEFLTYGVTSQVQFKIEFDTLGLDTSIPAQLCEFAFSYSSVNEISDNWEYSHDDSDPGNPSRVAFRLKLAYASSVPTLYFRAYDTSDTLVASHNTSANSSLFQYSTDGGTNWNSLGTIPNTVGTLVRYTFSTPPGVDVRPSIRES